MRTPATARKAAKKAGGARQPAKRLRPNRDHPCQAGLDLLFRQVLFIEGSRRDPELAAHAPAFGIDPEFWGAGAAEFALRMVLQHETKAKR